MIKNLKIVGGCFIVIALAYSIHYWLNRPLILPIFPELIRNNATLNETHSQYQSCTPCHQGSLFRDHTPEFMNRTHGKQAKIERRSCLNCHQQKNCQDCHLTKKPEWHNERFCNPGFNSYYRDEHFSVALINRNSCLECHQTRYQKQCANCHILEEHR